MLENFGEPGTSPVPVERVVSLCRHGYVDLISLEIELSERRGGEKYSPQPWIRVLVARASPFAGEILVVTPNRDCPLLYTDANIFREAPGVEAGGFMECGELPWRKMAG